MTHRPARGAKVHGARDAFRRMDPPLVYVDTSKIADGKVQPLREALSELVAFVEENVPRAIAYSAYIDEDEDRMTVVQVHPDSESLEQHIDASGDLFPKFANWLTLESIDVYGSPSDALLDRLEKKADLLGTGTVGVHPRHAGFDRFQAPETTA